MIIGILIGYGVVAVIHGLIMLFLFAMERSMAYRDEDDMRKYATWLLATPFWLILYVRGLARLLASAKSALSEGKKEEKWATEEHT